MAETAAAARQRNLQGERPKPAPETKTKTTTGTTTRTTTTTTRRTNSESAGQKRTRRHQGDESGEAMMRREAAAEDDRHTEALLAPTATTPERTGPPADAAASAKDQDAERQRRWRLGFGLLLVVVVIWVISSFMVQYIEGQLAAPFFLTYVGTALFIVLLPVSWATGSLGRILANDDLIARGDPRGDSAKASLRATVRGALAMSGFWFLAILTYNASLQYTSVTSSTILSSTSAVFTLVLSAVFRIERATAMHAVGVAACVLGSVFVGIADADTSSASKETFSGDLASLLSAFFYACYTLVIGYHFPNGDDSVDMALVFGIVGLANIVLLTPVVVFLHVSGFESLAGLTPVILAWILLQGLLDNVVSDYLWARAVLLTSPTVTTVGLSLTMPLSAALDIVFTSHLPSPLTVLGGVLVTVGFFAVSARPTAQTATTIDADADADAEEAHVFVDAHGGAAS